MTVLIFTLRGERAGKSMPGEAANVAPAGGQGGQGDGAAGDVRAERKLTRAEQLELWKQRRHGPAAKTAPGELHTTDKRSLQGLSSSQINQRTGGSGAPKGAKSDAALHAAAPVAVSTRRESGWAMGITSKHSRSGGKPAALRFSSDASASDNEQGRSSRESSVEREPPASAGKPTHKLQASAGSVAGDDSFSASTPVQPSPADDRRFSVHVAVDEDDDEVEWRVPVSGDSAPSSLVASPAAPPESGAHKALVISRDGTTAEVNSDDAVSDLISVQDTIAAEKEDANGSDGRVETHESYSGIQAEKRDIFRPQEDCGSGVLLSTRPINDAEAEAGQAQAQVAEASLPGAHLWNVGRSSGEQTIEDKDKDAGRLDVIAETWMEEVDVGDEDVTMEEVRSQLFDTTSRLAQCTALLQRMVVSDRLTSVLDAGE